MVFMSAADLAAAGRSPALPCRVNLPSNNDAVERELLVQQWLRVLPGKRYVARASLDDRQVLAKLFLGKRAAGKAEAELAGIERLRKADLATPGLIESGIADDGRAAWVITEFIDDGEDFSRLAGICVEGHWAQTEDLAPALEVAQTVARLHNAGLAQQDVHPGNFLLRKSACVTDEQCLVIDAADVQPLKAVDERLDNFSLFLAQLPDGWWRSLWQAYAQLANWLVAASPTPDEAAEYGRVCAAARRWQRWRADDLAAKSLRDCSLFQMRQTASRFESVWRREAEDLAPLLADLDAALAAVTLLKDGGSATVGLIDWHGRPLVIKRYNLKGFWHRFRRCWRPTRAWHSWLAAHKLRVLGVATPRPIALVEERWGPLRGRAYLLSECSAGTDLVNACEAGDEQLLCELGAALRRLLGLFSFHQVSHGDFKATNLLWREQLELIDLDSVCWHSRRSRWQKARDKDVARLLRNWGETSPQYQHLKQVLDDPIDWQRNEV